MEAYEPTQEQIITSQIENQIKQLRATPLAKQQLRQFIKGASREEKQFMLKFFDTADLNREIARRTETVQEAVLKICTAAENASHSINDLEDAELFLQAIISTLRGIAK